MIDNTARAKDDNVVETNVSKTEGASFNMNELQALAELVNEHGFTDFEFENENIRVRLSKMAAAPVLQSAPAAVPAVSSAPAESAPAEVQADPDAGLHKITSPIVGTFYRSPGPEKDAYVSEGSNVSAETTVCIVEAMKLMNEIQAEVSGEIIRIYVENGQPVEFGQALFGVRK
ncbi:MAG TPA: acetyl-CoA carboxylase biotin carboxyl carrier protein [Pyrinomonadaceae bacterium]|nr:acetyl-CoA carboxylase biotin carboxyl carrier protein [Chloracidobacterium sp.]MBP9934538.1 acetyl-CoA carboxylase biotin carboxyl carrier protein [Pyrinomonadaceae bacterium]MBK7802462.1 acetyl-CoA carboxylase biotin carboxyl carrier protein [Chloracidobacterium sp.]MBK9437330.1 acetyl-CoA carboxylase biotin carboxyl carrier protein [Chloracidobacterium sp.]MBL0240004.1 acetyl-CoA carboxylase biotin carboxyl carrier protein [Chloracidobacterium sp.]